MRDPFHAVELRFTRRRLGLIPILMLLCVVSAQAEQPEAESDPLVEAASTFSKSFLDGDLDPLYKLMTPEMEAAFPRETAERIRNNLLVSGPVEEVGEPWLEASDALYRRYRVPVTLEKRKIDLRVVFDGEGKVAGFFKVFHVEPPGEAAATPEQAQEAAPELTGHWEGGIELPTGELTVLVDLSWEDGTWSGTADIPMQGASGLPLAGIAVASPKIEFALADIPGDPTFRGALADGKIEGTFSQSGQRFPFTLGREAIPPPARPQEPRPPFPYKEEEVSYSNGEVRLAGTLTLPSEGGPFPAVVLISGSGPQDRNEEVFGHKPFLVLADHLTRSRIAVLRVDDRGAGDSTGPTEEATSEDFAGDVLAGVAFLRDHPEIDAERIGLIGHSEGGLIAPWVATRSEDVAFVVMMAGPGVPGDEILRRQTELISRVSGMDEERLARVLEAHGKLTAAVESGAEVDEMQLRARALIEAQLGEATSASAEESIGQTLDQLTSPWFRFFIAYDPRPALREVRVPVLALNGELDLQVDPGQNLPEIRKALEQGGNKDFTVKELPGLNHLFQKAETGAVEEYYTIEETLNPAALDAIREWILGHI